MPTPSAPPKPSAYKSLSQVERAFRAIKTTRLNVRPIHVYTPNRVRAHVFVCMAWYVEWHLRRRLAPLLFEDDDRDDAQSRRTSPVHAEVSERAKAKANTKLTPDGLPVHSMNTLLADLATLRSVVGTPRSGLPFTRSGNTAAENSIRVAQDRPGTRCCHVLGRLIPTNPFIFPHVPAS